MHSQELYLFGELHFSLTFANAQFSAQKALVHPAPKMPKGSLQLVVSFCESLNRKSNRPASAKREWCICLRHNVGRAFPTYLHQPLTHLFAPELLGREFFSATSQCFASRLFFHPEKKASRRSRQVVFFGTPNFLSQSMSQSGSQGIQKVDTSCTFWAHLTHEFWIKKGLFSA